MSVDLVVGTATSTTVPMNINNNGTLGTPVSLPLATSSLAGLMSADDKSKIVLQGGNSVSADMIVGTTTAQNMNLVRNSNPIAVVTSAGLGMPADKGIVNLSSTFNSSILPTATGTVISRNVADTNTTLIVKQDSAASSGLIQTWQKAGATVAFINRLGGGTFKAVAVNTTNANPNYLLDIDAGTSAGATTLGNFKQNSGAITIENRTATANEFLPLIRSKSFGRTDASMNMIAQGSDTYSSAAFILTAKDAAGTGPITGGNTFQLTNNSTAQFTVDYQGNLTVLGTIKGTSGMGPLSLYAAPGVMIRSAGYGAIFNTPSLTADRVISIPDASGTLAAIGTTAPSSATDTGAVGEIRVTSTYVYVCIATNTWVRAPFATW